MPEAQDLTCYRCNIQVSAKNKVCPFCKKPMYPSLGEDPQKEKEADIREQLVPQDKFKEKFQEIKKFGIQYWKWFLIGVSVLFAILALLMVSAVPKGITVEIQEDPIFPIKVEKIDDGKRVVLLKCTVTNRGKNIRGISLQSLSVMTELRWEAGGKVDKKRIFPTSPIHGDGSILQNEHGVFEIKVPEGVNAVALRPEMVNLVGNRGYILPEQRENPSLDEEQ